MIRFIGICQASTAIGLMAMSHAAKAYSRAAVDVVRGEELSLHQRISEAADPLLFGTWGGLSAKIVCLPLHPGRRSWLQ